MPRYQFVLLDADRTLFDFDMAEDLALTAVLEANGLPCTAEVKAVYREENHKAWALFEEGKVTKPQLTALRFSRFMERMGLQGDGAALNLQYTTNLATHCIPLEGAEEVCRLLAKECRLFIVTNGLEKVQKGRMSRCAFRDCFEAMFVSEEVGYQKPQKEYFDFAAQHIDGFDPAKAVVVGDSPASDILGANNAGLDSIWYNPKAEKM
ncbi:MAG: YjjG family noncanonical pyrimidine nucleotidase, partial [Oscillospiraceae bacterium]|nr:YjjG family noncanonical pyrimidine nucleotidase [Oscillospiraceae bacterium]